MATQPQIDAAFYEMVHRLRELPATGGDERRDTDRYTYCCLQSIAPFDGHSRPRQGDFVLRPLHDLSAGGFSFHTPDRPQTLQVIVALGRPLFKFFTAEIRHCTTIVVDEEMQYLVGCRLLDRLRGGDSLCPDPLEPC